MPTMRFDPSTDGIDDAPWTKLATIAEHLEDGTPVPSHLSTWFGNAVQYADGDAGALLRRLGLTQRRGRSTSDAWLKWGCRLHIEEARGMKPGKAIDVVLKEYAAANDGQEPSLSTLQRWRDRYREALAEAVNP